jgi:hypothetical protein
VRGNAKLIIERSQIQREVLLVYQCVKQDLRVRIAREEAVLCARLVMVRWRGAILRSCWDGQMDTSAPRELHVV